MAFGDSSRHPKWPKVANAVIEAGVRTREVVRQPHRRLPMPQRLLVNPAPGIMRDTPLVHPHVTREGTETPKSGQRSPRVRWHRLALLLHVVASVGPGTTAAHGCAGVSPRTHGAWSMVNLRGKTSTAVQEHATSRSCSSFTNPSLFAPCPPCAFLTRKGPVSACSCSGPRPRGSCCGDGLSARPPPDAARERP